VVEPNTYLVEPEQLPPRVIQRKVRAWVVSQRQDGFRLWVESQKKPEIQPKANCEGEDSGVKGQDERQKTAPLTPESSPKEISAPFFRKQPEKQS
jgi:hypothetical protein